MVDDNQKPKNDGPVQGITPETGRTIIFGVFCVVAGLILILMVAGFHWSPDKTVIGISLVGGLVVSGIVGIYFLSTRCSKCGQWLVAEEVNVETVDSKKGYKVVKRTEENSKGKTIRSWNEQVRVKTVTYHHHHQCRNCGNQWIVTRQQELETFDD